MKKLIMLLPTKGKTKEQIKKESVEQLKKKGYLKNSEEKAEEWEAIFIPTLHKGMKEFYSPKKKK